MSDKGSYQSLATPNASSFILLYTSHFLQTFGDRLWQFAVPLLLTELFDTLFPQALISFFTYFAVFIGMPFFGAWIDTADRLYVVTTTIWIQNLCICISSALMYLLATFHEDIITEHINYKLVLIFGGIILTSMIGQIMGQGATLSLEKDWVVILCSSFDNDDTLTLVNGRMRRIDLFCKLMAPAFIGFCIQYLGNTQIDKVYAGSIIMFVWNIIGLVLEWISIKLLYNRNINSLCIINKEAKPQDNPFIIIKNGYQAYLQSSIFGCSLSYSMLYVNVLACGDLVNVYLKFRGISYLILGISKGFGAMCGILGTLLTPFLHSRMGMTMELIGLITIILFWVTLSPVGIADIIIGDNNIQMAYIILVCMVLARLFLWAFDLAINQLMQTKVNSEVRGQINGTQSAICQIFYMVSSVLTMIFYAVNSFFIVVWVTIIVLLLSAIIYCLWYFIPWCQKDGYNVQQQPANEQGNEQEQEPLLEPLLVTHN